MCPTENLHLALLVEGRTCIQRASHSDGGGGCCQSLSKLLPSSTETYYHAVSATDLKTTQVSSGLIAKRPSWDLPFIHTETSLTYTVRPRRSQDKYGRHTLWQRGVRVPFSTSVDTCQKIWSQSEVEIPRCRVIIRKSGVTSNVKFGPRQRCINALVEGITNCIWGIGRRRRSDLERLALYSLTYFMYSWSLCEQQLSTITVGVCRGAFKTPIVIALKASKRSRLLASPGSPKTLYVIMFVPRDAGVQTPREILRKTYRNNVT